MPKTFTFLCLASLMFASPCALAEVKWVPPPPGLEKVGAAFEAVRFDGNAHGDSEADTAIASVWGGPLRGEWYFRGGDFMRAPTSFARIQLEMESGDVLATFVCEDKPEACAKLRERAQAWAEHLASGPPPPPKPPDPPGYTPPPPPQAAARRSEPLDFKHHFETDPACLQCEGPAMPPSVFDGGTVVLSVSYDRKGNVTDVVVARSSGNESLDAAAMEAARKWKLKPGTIDGRGVAGAAMVPVEFAARP